MSHTTTLKILFPYIFLFSGLLFSVAISAQEEEPTDDLGNLTDAFQEHFFEALKQKSIENYELAIAALEKAKKTANEDPQFIAVVEYEMAKNFMELQKYPSAEENLDKVIAQNPDRIDVLETLYDLYYLQRNYDKAILLVKKLIVNDEDYKEDLANLYTRTKQYDKALVILDELEESWGESVYRNVLRNQIYRATGNTDRAIYSLEEKVDKNPKNEKDYLSLIYLYSEEGNTKKAYDTALELLRNNPKNELVHVALYKFYLDDNKTEEAVASMDIVFKSKTIDTEIQYKVLGDFLQFVTENPSYEHQLDNVISTFSAEGKTKVYEKLGGYYMTKANKEIALKFYEKGIANDPDNFSLLKKTLLLQLDFSKYEEAKKLSNNALEVFPAQALLYLLNGVANNNLLAFDSAIESLEAGLDYLIDDSKMEKDFYIQLVNAYTAKGDAKKANEYTKKAQAILLDN
ncbi:tetratricopeptide repeat protein [Patiriisocius sp. Uisw_017]|jgi:tetratricopeptide (TPR) repeat protein|uniref:tetratricopeptide repeat protein n=1 Tax=Patiriisocius sp. Uisw_017 TaxID=3230968 RepID=UPI0039EC295E